MGSKNRIFKIMIKLIEETHTYLNDMLPNCKYTSTTTVLGYYHDPYDVDFFAEKSCS